MGGNPPPRAAPEGGGNFFSGMEEGSNRIVHAKIRSSQFFTFLWLRFVNSEGDPHRSTPKSVGFFME